MPDYTPGEDVEFKPTIELKTGTVQGGEGVPSEVTLSVPQKGPRIASVDAKGSASASASEGGGAFTAKIKNAKKLKAKSRKGLFAIARIGNQRDTGLCFFDVIFGLAGESETKKADTGKDRPHIAVYPSGNGKFFRLAEYKCNIVSRMNFDLDQQLIVPTGLEVECQLTGEVLLLEFSIDQSERACYLDQISFS
ncbi:hypothetical protein [Marinimicrobium sp. C2-29]|uniref:hypothetical protein n=1 Tax=Marinimicrobium sp. C2-29 TaxID=3139825 RepID=UPI00313A2312